MISCVILSSNIDYFVLSSGWVRNHAFQPDEYNVLPYYGSVFQLGIL